MKTIKTNAVITSLRSKVDRSLGLTVATPELTSEEKAEFMNLQGVNVDITVEPIDEVPAEIYKVKKKTGSKTQSQRIRAVLFILWKNEGEPDDFETYYRNKTEGYIELLKDRIDS